jgi:hypothetical protein
MICALLALVTVATAEPVTLTRGPLQVGLDRSSGEVVSLSLSGRDIAGGKTGGFRVRDHAAAEQLAVFPVALEPAADAVAFSGEVQGLQLSGTLAVEAGRIDVRGEIAEQGGRDRCVSLRFALPVAPEGLRWSRDLCRRVPVAGDSPVTNAGNVGLGSGKLDLWPLSAVDCEAGTLALATRIDEPAIFHCFADGQSGQFCIQFDFALTELTAKLPRRAPFHFAILATDTPLGLRSALDEYYATWPDLFSRRTDRLGGWFAWGDVLHLAPPISDFGLMFHEGPDARGHASGAVLDIPRYPYIEPGMYQLHFGDLDHRPSREEIMARLNQYAAEAEDAHRLAGLDERAVWDRKMRRAILRSGIRDAEQDLVIAQVGQYPWVAGSRWAAQFALLLDPDIEHGAAATYLEQMRRNLENPDWGEGRYLDSYSAHIRSVDYSPQALAVADFPACFDRELRPCQLMAIPMFEYVEALGKLLDETGRTILVNAYDHSAPFPFHRFDILGKEHWASPVGRLFERYRCMAGGKVVTDLPSDTPVGDDFLRSCLLYCVFPGGYGRGDWGQEQMRAEYRRVVPLLRLESRLGWRPLTFASASAPEVLVERYGAPPGPVLYAVHNRFLAKAVTLELGRRGCGPGELQCLELVDGRPLQWECEADVVRVRLGMGSGDTCLLAVGNLDSFGRLYGMIGRDKRDDVALCLREWTARRGEPHPQEAQVRAAAADLPALEPAADPLNVRIAQLLAEARDAEAYGAAPPTLRSAATIAVPHEQTLGAALPWRETFDGLDPERWRFDESHPGTETREGRLAMFLPPGKNAVSVTSQEAFDFGSGPVEISYSFEFNHGGHQWYLMQSLNLRPSASGAADDFLHVRCDPGIRIRLENGETPASGYEKSLTPYQSYETNVPHQVSLTLDGRRFRLLIDGRLHGEGEHELQFGLGYITLGLYSGHGGHDDVCYFDDLQVTQAQAAP